MSRHANPPSAVPVAPARSKHLERETVATLKELIDAIYRVDLLLRSYSKILHRAQPVVNGKVVLQFSESAKVTARGETHKDVEPYLAKIYTDGAPIREIAAKNLIGQRPCYVTDRGRRLPLYNDPLIKALLSDIEALMAYRTDLKKTIGRLRMAAAPQLRGVTTRLTKFQTKLAGITDKLA